MSSASSAASTPTPAPRVESRVVVSAPSRTIQVEQVRISEHQKSSVASALRAGRAAAASAE